MKNLNKQLVWLVALLLLVVALAITSAQLLVNEAYFLEIIVFACTLVTMGLIITLFAKTLGQIKAIRSLVYRDYLTGLPNRHLYEKLLDQTIARAHRHHINCAILFIDLDNFKQINDSLGHAMGDILIKQVAERFQPFLRKNDSLCRFGGDEFIIILEGLAQHDDATIVANRLLHCLELPFVANKNTLFTSASIGIVTFPSSTDSVSTLTQSADIAMYQAKAKGGNVAVVFTDKLRDDSVKKNQIHKEIREAMEKNHFYLSYQPRVSLPNKKITGIETLVRWDHKSLGLLYPDSFITIAEETGLIIGLGHWIFEHACEQLAAWNKLGFNEIQLAINFSAEQLIHSQLAQFIIKTITKYELNPKHIELEITETAALKNPEITERVLKELNNIGIKIFIDDFGIEYSSLRQLRQFPIQGLKIDKSFIRDVIDEPSDAEIVKSIIALGKGLNVEVIAEGVETQAQYDFLVAANCPQAQGFYISEPRSPEHITALLQRDCGDNIIPAKF